MKAIVADAYGTGVLVDKDRLEHELSEHEWTEADLRDEIVTADGQTAWVRYRDDGRTVEVAPNTTYGIEVLAHECDHTTSRRPALLVAC